MSWFGIQGLMVLPHQLIFGSRGEVFRTVKTSFQALHSEASMAKYLQDTDRKFLAAGLPGVEELVQKHNLHVASLQGNVDIGFPTRKIPIIGGVFSASDRAFAAGGDTGRLSNIYDELMARGGSSVNDEQITEIVRALNRATGVGSTQLGSLASFVLFAPRFFTSQIETVVHALDLHTIEGSIARKRLLTLMGTGVTMTWLANELRGEETIFDPTDSNFMRIRNVMGTDISVFGPWDSLIRATVHGAQGDFGYVARSKLGPLPSLAWSFISGETFLGEDITDPKVFAKELALPFAYSDIGDIGVIDFGGGESLGATAISVFGVKTTPLSGKEIIDQHMTNANLDPEDPLERRQWLAEHPEDRPKAKGAERRAQEAVRGDIETRTFLNDTRATSNEITLTTWREDRKNLLRERRHRLEALIEPLQDREPRNEQERWIRTYFELFEANADPVTGDIIGEEFDFDLTRWIADNGSDAYDYVQRFNLVDTSDIERSYIESLQTLNNQGFFDMPRLRRMKSGASEGQILGYRQQVIDARLRDPKLARMDFSRAVIVFLRRLNIDKTIIRDVINSGKDAFKDRDTERFRRENPNLMVWFNDNATWQTFQELNNRAPTPIGNALANVQ